MAQHPLHKMVAPRLLLAHIRSAVPYRFPLPKQIPQINGSLADKAKAPLGWWDVIHSAKNLTLAKNPSTQEFMDYFTLCLAAHHCTVASYVPTDVDTKIRNHLWRLASAPGVVERMCNILLAATQWDREPIAARQIDDAEHGSISGLDGEWLSVFIPAMHAAHKHGLTELTEKLWQWIETEIQREALIFKQSLSGKDPVRTLKLSAILSHNAGDIDQGIGSCQNVPEFQSRLNSIRHMAKENTKVQGGMFALAADIYRVCMANEFHRHYPLREIKVLREHARFAFPMSPFLDEWAGRLTQDEALNLEQRLEILGGLIHGCDIVKNQSGYYRAISGFLRALPDRSEIDHLPVNLLMRIRQPDMVEHINMTTEGFAQLKAKELYQAFPDINPESVQYYLSKRS